MGTTRVARLEVPGARLHDEVRGAGPAHVLTDSISGLAGQGLYPGVGDASAPHQVAYQATHAVAEQLGTTPLAVPGDHEAVTRHPGELAELLRRVLGLDGRRSGR
jgi:hypothetical protein